MPPTDRPPEADPVVAQFAADQAGAVPLADGALVGKGDLQRGVRRFRARLVKNTLFRLGGAISASRAASSNGSG